MGFPPAQSGKGVYLITSRNTEARRLAERGRLEAQRGAVDRALVLYDRALAMLDGATDEDVVTVLRWKGTAYAEIGRTQLATGLYRQSIAMAEAMGSAAGRADGLNCLASMAQRRGSLDEADELYHQAADAAIEGGVHPALGRIRQNQGTLSAIRGQWDLAVELYQSSVRAFELAGDEEAVSWGLNNLGKLCTDQKRHLEAEAVFAWGLRIARARESRLVEGLLELNRAELLLGIGRVSEAREGCTRALALAEQRGDPLRRSDALRVRAAIERECGDLAAALVSLSEARGLAAEAEDALLVAKILKELGEVLRERGEREASREAWTAAHADFARLGAAREAKEVEGKLATADR